VPDAQTLTVDDAPVDLAIEIKAFFPPPEWDNAARVAFLESGWDPFALNDSATAAGGCGLPLFDRGGVGIVSERSVGYFQINSCNYPGWIWGQFYNVHHNVGTAHALWAQRGWSPWYFSSKSLGLS
jgi:hypothetical protein